MLQGTGFKGRRNLVVCFRERQEVPSWNEREREREREREGEREIATRGSLPGHPGRVQDARLRVNRVRVRVRDLGFGLVLRVQGSGFRVEGLLPGTWGDFRWRKSGSESERESESASKSQSQSGCTSRDAGEFTMEEE